MMFPSGFADGISFSEEFYAPICNLDWFPKDTDSLSVQHIGTYLTNHGVSHSRRWNFDIHNWKNFNSRL